jgi:phenylalanyl-tRNA synthetase alpha subunit
MGTVKCIEYNKQYYKLDLKLYKEDRRLYELVKINLWLKELQDKYYFAKRWNKPTLKGTNVKFKAVETKEEYQDALKKIRDYVKQINAEFGFNFVEEKEPK